MHMHLMDKSECVGENQQEVLELLVILMLLCSS